MYDHFQTFGRDRMNKISSTPSQLSSCYTISIHGIGCFDYAVQKPGDYHRVNISMAALMVDVHGVMSIWKPTRSHLLSFISGCSKLCCICAVTKVSSPQDLRVEPTSRYQSALIASSTSGFYNVFSWSQRKIFSPSESVGRAAPATCQNEGKTGAGSLPGVGVFAAFVVDFGSEIRTPFRNPMHEASA